MASELASSAIAAGCVMATLTLKLSCCDHDVSAVCVCVCACVRACLFVGETIVSSVGRDSSQLAIEELPTDPVCCNMFISAP